MASTLIHLAVAKEVGKQIERSSKEYYLGSIAPDLGKIVTGEKHTSHFQKPDEETPNLDFFLVKYKDYLKNNDFVLGYYVHLLTDYFWFKYFNIKVFKSGNNPLFLL